MTGPCFFNEDFQFSLGSRQRMDLELLRQVIPNCVEVVKSDIALDKLGIDYVATLDGGAKIYIDAKSRRKGASKRWKDGIPLLALEVWSVCPDGRNKGKPGWTVNRNTECDMILYTFDREDTDKFYLFPFQHLRMAFQHNYKEWKTRFGTRCQFNGNYYSECMFVPAPFVIDAISAEMTGLNKLVV